MGDPEEYPRELTARERELLLWLLPEDRPGYAAYRGPIERWKVAARGRRGEGDFILAPAGHQPDLESPLPQVIAYGVVEGTDATIMACVRERLEDQIEFEVMNLKGEMLPERFVEIRRWSFSSWLPSAACPSCGGVPRRIEMRTERGQRLVLAICPSDQRVWVYDAESGMNLPVPVTNFYNELMLHKNIRDPAIALDSKLLFSALQQFTDDDLVNAFASYNALHTKFLLDRPIVRPEPAKRTLLKKIATMFASRQP